MIDPNPRRALIAQFACAWIYVLARAGRELDGINAEAVRRGTDAANRVEAIGSHNAPRRKDGEQPVLTPFAHRMKAERERLVVPQKVIARVLGYSQRTIANWEAGADPVQLIQDTVISKLTMLEPGDPALARPPRKQRRAALKPHPPEESFN